MVFAPVDLVLDAVVREVDLAVEVRQVVLARPLADLVVVPVRAAVAVAASPIVFLQELLILALQIVVEDDAPNLEPAVIITESGLLLAVGRVEIGVVAELTLATDAGVERL